MSIRTHCLNVLCLLLLVYPVAVPSIVSNMIFNFIKHDPQKQKDSFWLFSILNFLLIILLIILQTGYDFSLHTVTNNSMVKPIILGVLLAPFILFIEFIVGAFIVKLQKKRINAFTVDEKVGKEKPVILLSILLISVLEEVLFRGFCYIVTIEYMSWSIEAFLLFSAGVYAINHIHEGISTTIQKFITGILLGIAFVLTGCNIIVPIVAHIAENVIVIIWSKAAYD